MQKLGLCGTEAKKLPRHEIGMKRREFLTLQRNRAGTAHRVAGAADQPEGCGVPIARDDGWPVVSSMTISLSITMRCAEWQIGLWLRAPMCTPSW